MNLFEIAQEIEELDGEQIRQKYYGNMPANTFLAIVNADPKTTLPGKIGRYAKILLDIFKKGNLKLEDIPKAKEYLTAAYKYGVSLDATKIESLSDIFDMVKKYIAKGTNDSEIAAQSLNQNEFEILFRGKDWMIYKPLTEKAACYLGVGTQWCTTWGKESLNPSYKDRKSHYPSYSKQGTLYIIVNRLNPETKYQFHFESNQFMDSSDRGIDVGTFLYNNKEVRNFFFPSFITEVDESDKETQLNRITLLSPNDANELLKKVLTNKQLKNPLISYFIGTGKNWIDFDFENKKTYPRKINEVNSVLQHLSYSSYNNDADYYDVDSSASLVDAFKKYYEEFKYDLKQKLHISTYEDFYDNFYASYIDNENISSKLDDESRELTDEDYQDKIKQEQSRIERTIKINEYSYELTVSLPIGYLIPFLLTNNYKGLDDKREMVDGYIEHYNLTEYPEIYTEYIEAEYDNKGKFHDAVVDYFENFIMDDENDNLKIKQKFEKIFNDVFKNQKTFENDIVMIQIKSTVIDYENETIPAIILNKETNERYEGDVKIDALAAYALNYKLFEEFLNFKRLIY